MNTRTTLGWLLLVLLAVVGAGGAVLGVSQAPRNVPLAEAVPNTLGAASYSEVLTESTPQGKQADYLVYQAPDRLGGYVQSGNMRRYVYVIGASEYQSLTVKAGTPPEHLVFYKQPGSGAAALDPAHSYLRYAEGAKDVKQSGSQYTFTLTQSGQTGVFVYTVSGKYVSEVTLTVGSASVQLVISQVGTSPPVNLPAGSKVITSSSTGTGSATGSSTGSGTG
jgi:hypothetical protein